MADDLSALVRAAVDSGITYRQLEQRAVDPVTRKRASKDLFHQIALGSVDRMPYDYHLRAMAVALNVSYERVREAAIAQWLPIAPVDEHQRAEAEFRAQLETNRPRFSKAAIDRMLAVWNEEWRAQHPTPDASHDAEPERIQGVV